MVRVRKLVLAIAAASALSVGTAHALGLGEIDLQSSLSQPLVAEIELLEVRDLASGEIIPALASPEEFNKAGVDRQYFLTDLKFTPIIKPNGKSVIRITSTKPVREPYVNFLVEVLWPNGRLLREYTLLLDPPMYAPTPVVSSAPSMPVAAPAPRPQSSASAARPTARAVTRPSPAPQSSSTASAAIDGDQYKTSANDTLWDIALRSRRAGSVHQTMLAIQDLNPEAFIDGNINRLKKGQILRLPTEEQIRSRSQKDALAQVAEQNSAWREGRSLATGTSRQLDATKRSTAAPAPSEADAKDTLKLVSAAGSDKGKAGDNTKALSDQLAVTKESLDSSRRESEELKSRLADLQSQLEKAQRLVALKDTQLAKLQADLAKQEKTADAPAAAAPAAPETPVAPVKPDAAKPVAPEAENKTAEKAPVDFNYEESSAKPETAKPAAAAPAVEAAKPAAKPAAAVKPVKPAKPAKPVAPAKPTEPQGLFDQMLSNPMLLGAVGGGALLVLLIALMVVSRRNAMKEAALQENLESESSESAFASDMGLQDDAFSGFADPASEEAALEPDELVAPQTTDALGEADIYIAYGKFSQAAELLHNAINDEPQRSDLRLKLMEVDAELGDRDGFARQEQELREIGGAEGAIEQLKAKYPLMAASAVGGAAAVAEDALDDFAFDDLDLGEPDAGQPAVALDDSLDLNLDDLELGSDDLSPAPAGDSSLDDLGLDFDAPAEPTASPAGDMDFNLDLGGDAADDSLSLGDDLSDFSLDLEAEKQPAATADDDFMLNLSDELPVSNESEVEADLSLPADFDLSLPDEAPVAADEDFAAQLGEVSAELDDLESALAGGELTPEQPQAASPVDLDMDDDFDFLSGADETSTKLDLARAYIDMGDSEGARDILDEVVAEGSEAQQQEARELIAKLS